MVATRSDRPAGAGIITDRLPRLADADVNGDIFAYVTQHNYVPIPWGRFSWGVFIGWRRIFRNDYAHVP